VNAYQRIFDISGGEVRVYGLPGGGAYYTLALVLCFDRIELKADVLREISHERENFAYALVHNTQGCKNIHDCARDGLDTLFRSFQILIS